jgi:hypothetical protein
VGGRGEADDDDAGVRIAQRRHRSGPVLLAPERRPRVGGDGLTPGHEARARTALDHLALDLEQRGEAV